MRKGAVRLAGNCPKVPKRLALQDCRGHLPPFSPAEFTKFSAQNIVATNLHVTDFDIYIYIVIFYWFCRVFYACTISTLKTKS